ncbi:hypothetical protein LTS18_009332, partial [Coniosporium uncinatum]
MSTPANSFQHYWRRGVRINGSHLALFVGLTVTIYLLGGIQTPFSGKSLMRSYQYTEEALSENDPEKL